MTKETKTKPLTFDEKMKIAHLKRLESSNKVSRLKRDLDSALRKGTTTKTGRKHIEIVKERLQKAREQDDHVQDSYNERFLMKKRETFVIPSIFLRDNDKLFLDLPHKGDHINVRDESTKKTYEGVWTGSRYTVDFNDSTGFNKRLYFNLRKDTKKK